ncbi:hypothetical protein [Sphingomonas sp.]|uniref:hypothetical protein n=1 Tax=Sphingomonas sp. TaxID=28214 RepID=UPI0035BC9729
MLTIILLLFSFAALNIGEWLAIVLATTIAAYYRWRSLRISRALLAARPAFGSSGYMASGAPTRRQRRLMARHLPLSIAMTTHYSLFPRSGARGYAMVEMMGSGTSTTA